jgi:hypothetical protein
MTGTLVHSEGNPKGHPEIDVTLNETADLDSGPAAEDLVDGEVEIEKSCRPHLALGGVATRDPDLAGTGSRR